MRRLGEGVESDKELDGLQAHLVSQFSKFVSLVPYLPDELQVMAMQVREPARLTDMVASYLKIAVEESQDLLSTNDVRARLEKLIVILGREIELLELGHKIQSQVQTELNKNQREYYLRQQLKAIQKELGEGDAGSSEIENLEKKNRGGQDARRRAQGGRQGAGSAQDDPARIGRAYRGADLLRLAGQRALVGFDRRQLGHQARPLGARRRPFRSRKGQGADPRIPRRAQAQERYQGADPMLRGTAGNRQDLARPLDCARARTQVCAAVARRHPRRGRDSRPSPHLYRLAARPHDPGAAQRRFQQSAVHPRRGRQAGDGLSRRPGLGVARSARPRAEQRLRRSLSRRALRSLQGVVPDHGQRARSDSARAARPDGSAGVAGLHRGGEAPNRRTPPGAQADFRERAGQHQDRVRQGSGVRNHPQLHARGRPAQPRARNRPRVPENRALDHRGRNRPRARHARHAASLSRPAQIFLRGGQTHPGTRRRDGARLDAQRRRHPVHREHPDDRAEGRDHHWLAGRRDEGVGAGGALLRAVARGATRHRTRLLRKIRLHIHVPAGAIPKDEPSAGVTIAASLASLLSARPVRSDVAMTGEITLRGKVLPVGGVKGKVLAARRAGIKTVILPRRNESDLEDIPEEARKEMEFVFVDTVDEVLRHALCDGAEQLPEAAPAGAERTSELARQGAEGI